MLKDQIAALETHGHAPVHQSLELGIAPVDAALGGGLMRGALHEVASPAKAGSAAATGFAVALASLAIGLRTAPQRPATRQEVLWIAHDFAALECGGLYGPGLILAGTPLQRLIVVRVRTMRDALWAMEEGLKCPGVAITVADVLDDGSAADATASRRLALAAADSGAIGLLLRAKPSSLGSTAATRWEVASAPGVRDRYGGLGRPTFSLTLTKNRRGPPGHWLVTWDHHERAFQSALSLAVASPADDGPHRIVARA